MWCKNLFAHGQFATFETYNFEFDGIFTGFECVVALFVVAVAFGVVVALQKNACVPTTVRDFELFAFGLLSQSIGVLIAFYKRHCYMFAPSVKVTTDARYKACAFNVYSEIFDGYLFARIVTVFPTCRFGYANFAYPCYISFTGVTAFNNCVTAFYTPRSSIARLVIQENVPSAAS